MSVLRMILVILLCIPVGYLFLYLSDKLMDLLMADRRKKKNEKRSVYNDRRSGWGR